MKIDEELRGWIAARGLTQQEAARKLGVPFKTLVNWIQGRNEPRGLARTTLEKLIRKR